MTVYDVWFRTKKRIVCITGNSTAKIINDKIKSFSELEFMLTNEIRQIDILGNDLLVYVKES